MGNNVDTAKMTAAANDLSIKVEELRNNINKLVNATKRAQQLKDKAMSYNGKVLKDLTIKKTPTDSDRSVTRVIKKKAIIKNKDGGKASSGIRTITGVPKENALLQLLKITDLTDNDIPEVVRCINENTKEIDTTLANIASNRDTTTADDLFNSNEATDTNNPTSNNPQQRTANTDGPGGGSGPSGGGSGPSGGGGTGTKPNYRRNAVTSNNGSSRQNNNSNQPASNTSRPNTSNNITFNNNNANKPNTPTNTGTTKPNTTSNHPTSSNTTPHKNDTPTTETSSDNPTASAVVYTGKGTNPTYEEGTPTSSANESPIEVLGEDVIEQEDLGNSIINGVERILPQGVKGKKVQHGSVLIPITSGLTAAAAAGLGGKVLLDKADNNMFAGAAKDDDEDDDSETHSHEETQKSKKDDKSWLYGMGVGVAMENLKNEDYEIEDDTPKQETLEDD